MPRSTRPLAGSRKRENHMTSKPGNSDRAIQRCDNAREALLAAAVAFVKGCHSDEDDFSQCEVNLVHAAAVAKKAASAHLRESAMEDGYGHDPKSTGEPGRRGRKHRGTHPGRWHLEAESRPPNRCHQGHHHERQDTGGSDGKPEMQQEAKKQAA